MFLFMIYVNIFVYVFYHNGLHFHGNLYLKISSLCRVIIDNKRYNEINNIKPFHFENEKEVSQTILLTNECNL